MNISEQKQTLFSVGASVVLATAVMLAPMPEAMAGTTAEATQASRVEDVVTDLGGGNYNYSYTVFNDATSGFDPSTENFVIPVIIDWELPFFDDMNITNILSPDGWASSIEQVGVANAATGWDGIVSWFDPTDPWYPLFGPDSPFGENNLTQVLRWYCIDPFVETGEGTFGECGDGEIIGTPIFPVGDGDPNSLGGFGFDSTFSAAAAPYQASWLDLPVQSGDPAFPFAGGIPGSPSVTGASANVPEPTTFALMAIGLLGVFSVSRRRNKTV